MVDGVIDSKHDDIMILTIGLGDLEVEWKGLVCVEIFREEVRERVCKIDKGERCVF